MADLPEYLKPDYFEQLYVRDPDPWRFATSDYERDKYAATVAALPRARFRRGFEVGCSIGVLTRQLAERCDRLVTADIAETALVQARTRCADLAQVEVARLAVPGEWPDGRFDLVLFSEVLYYLGLPGIDGAAARTLASLEPDGVVILVNWRGPTDGACRGERAARRFISRCRRRLRLAHQVRTKLYRLDVLESLA